MLHRVLENTVYDIILNLFYQPNYWTNYHNLSIWHIFISFSFDNLFNPKLFLISLLQVFFIKCSNNFFTIEIINNICPWNCIFNFTNNKNFFRPIWCISFSKNIFVFRNSYVITNFKFRIFIINFFLKSI